MNLDTSFLVACVLLALLQIADLWLTTIALELGGGEGNPFAAWLIRLAGGNVWLGGSLIKIVVTGLVVWAGSIQLACFSVGLMAFVAWNNWTVIRKLRSRRLG